MDVAEKAVTARLARAEGFVGMKPETLAILISGDAKKGDVFAAARIAGIMAAKKTSDLIPLCHPLQSRKPRSSSRLRMSRAGSTFVRSKGDWQTGVEMEALTAVSVAALTIYDMLKAVDRGMAIHGIRLVEKSGGQSGNFKAMK